MPEVSPRAWTRYWAVGYVLGPASLAFGIASGNVELAMIGTLVLFVSVGMTAFWRRRVGDRS